MRRGPRERIEGIMGVRDSKQPRTEKRLGEGTKPDLLHVQRTERREPGNAKVKDLLEIDEAITRMKDHANLLTIRDL